MHAVTAPSAAACGPEALREEYNENPAAGFVRSLMCEMGRRYGGKVLPRSLVRPIQDYLDGEWRSFCRLEKGSSG